MRRLLPALLLAALPLLGAYSFDDPLICVDPGPTTVGPVTIDLPKVCVL